MKIRLRGRGRPSPDGGERGDIVVQVTVRPHPVFTRDGINLRVTVPMPVRACRPSTRCVAIGAPGPGTACVRTSRASAMWSASPPALHCARCARANSWPCVLHYKNQSI